MKTAHIRYQNLTRFSGPTSTLCGITITGGSEITTVGVDYRDLIKKLKNEDPRRPYEEYDYCEKCVEREPLAKLAKITL